MSDVAELKPNLGGRPPHEPTKAMREQVQVAAGLGFRQDAIADLVGVAPKTLRLHYQHEIRFGKAMANAKVAAALFNKAIGGDVAAMIFWLKTQAGWSEKTRVEHSGPDGSPIVVYDAIKRTIVDPGAAGAAET